MVMDIQNSAEPTQSTTPQRSATASAVHRALIRLAVSGVAGAVLLLTVTWTVTYLPASQRLLISATPVAGLSTAERILAVKKILAFYSTGDERLLAGYTPDEQAHLVEVSSVIKNAWRIFYALLLTTLVGFVFIARRYGFSTLRRQLKNACGITAVGSLLILLAGWLGFDFFFERFHQRVFSAAPWAFDPAVSRLVNEFPPEYFRAVVVTILLIASGVSLCGWLMLRKSLPPHTPPS